MASAAAAAAQDIDGFSSVGVGREHEFEAGRIAVALNGECELSCGESFKISRGREPTADGEASLLQREERTRRRDMWRPMKLGASTPVWTSSAESTVSMLACRIEWPDSSVALGFPGWREVGADFAMVPFLTAARHCP